MKLSSKYTVTFRMSTMKLTSRIVAVGFQVLYFS